ncbi:MAG: hypothetical protein ABR537_08080 [Gemmatimonadales bacterium]
MSACDAGLRVTGFGTTGGGGGGGTGGGGTGGGGTNASALSGTWRNVSSLALSSGETAVFDVRWTFDGAGGCTRTRIETIVNGATGSETTETIGCTYTVNGAVVTVTFAGASVPSRFAFGFSGGDLLLDGTRFTRLA